MSVYKLKYYFGLLIIFVLLFSDSTSSGKEILSYRLIRIYFDSTFSFKDLNRSGIDPEGADLNKSSLELIVNNSEFEFIKSKNIRYDLICDDYEKVLEKRILNSEKNLPVITSEKNFRLGSMGGSYRLDEVYRIFDSMRLKEPDYVGVPEVIGYSIEDRPIMAYWFGSKNPSVTQEVLLTALHHAREGAGLTTLVYFLWNLIEGIGTGDSEAKFLLDNRRICVIPVVNPDGVAFNEVRAPNGGGLWRKNRRKINDSTYGVDLNRNYGPKQLWDVGNSGLETNPKYETYKGESPFSEPETQAVRDFCIKHRFSIACNYHTYGNLIIFPWGAVGNETPDSIWYRSFTENVTEANHYSYGRGPQTVGYEVTGDSDDWMYYTLSDKPKIFAMTPEVGSVLDGFWPLPERYIPIAKDNLYMNYQLVWSAGANLRFKRAVYDYDSLNREGVVTLTVQNIGLDGMGKTAELELECTDNNVKIENPVRFVLPLNPKETQTERFVIDEPDNFINGYIVGFVCKIIQDSIVHNDTFELQLYKYRTYNVYEDGELGKEWINDNWNVTDDKTIGRKVLTDSPGGNYSDLDENYLIYSKGIDIEGDKATLEFNAHWSIEPKYDVAKIEASSDSGMSWKNLRSSKMRMGIGLKGSRQDSGKFGFDGFEPDYVRQECDLSEFVGKRIILRFGMLSDKALDFDGIFLDRIRIRFYDRMTGVGDDYGRDRDLSFSYIVVCEPNPVKPGEPLKLELKREKLKLSGVTNDTELSTIKDIAVYNYMGEEVYRCENLESENMRVKHEIPMIGFGEGIYFVRTITNKFNFFNKIIVMP